MATLLLSAQRRFRHSRFTLAARKILSAPIASEKKACSLPCPSSESNVAPHARSGGQRSICHAKIPSRRRLALSPLVTQDSPSQWTSSFAYCGPILDIHRSPLAALQLTCRDRTLTESRSSLFSSVSSTSVGTESRRMIFGRSSVRA
jgi:hypothetical protein